MLSENLTLRNEIWLDIPDFNNYQISNYGRVFSKAKEWTCGNGAIHKVARHEVAYNYSYNSDRTLKYLRVILTQDGRSKSLSVSRLVATLFIPNPENKPQVDHINHDTLNNHVSNLRWVTAKENCDNRRGKYAKR